MIMLLQSNCQIKISLLKIGFQLKPHWYLFMNDQIHGKFLEKKCVCCIEIYFYVTNVIFIRKNDIIYSEEYTSI